MEKLNLPFCCLKFKNNGNHTLVFDKIRKKYVILTQEEWVRQHFIHFLIEQKKYPSSLISVEKQLIINNLKKRSDILVFNAKGFPNIIIECKAPKAKITQKTFDQIARYNLKLKANYLVVTNGLEHYFCKLNSQKQAYVFLKDIPNY